VFRGDLPTIRKAQITTREAFEKHKNETDIDQINKLLQEVKEVQEILETQVVQAQITKDNQQGKLIERIFSFFSFLIALILNTKD
jgi:hypothetical protein